MKGFLKQIFPSEEQLQQIRTSQCWTVSRSFQLISVNLPREKHKGRTV